MDTVLDFRSFDPRFKTALIFSIFEGLLQGKNFLLISDEDPQLIEDQFKQASVKNFELTKNHQIDGTWKVKIEKISSKHSEGGCCGICVGDSHASGSKV